MSAIVHDTGAATAATATHAAAAGKVFALVRIAIGFIFVWAFLDKLFGLGRSTPSGKGWLFGVGDGNPTKGYLSSLDGTFAEAFKPIAGAGWANWLFMLGLLCIGGALMLGVAMRIAAISGSLMLFMMWLTALPIATNPFVDEHLVFLLTILGLWLGGYGAVWGLQTWWDDAVGSKVAFLK